MRQLTHALAALLVASFAVSTLGAETRLEWEPVAAAANYFVEVARDADFLIEAKSVTTQASPISRAGG